MTWHIHIEGQVQGVGFRPFVYLSAAKRKLKGWVNNASDGVHIVFNGDENSATEFYNEVTSNAPRLSKITSSSIKQVSERPFHDFRIAHSTSTTSSNLLLTPDFAICNECRNDISERGNERYFYPFTTCTNCGPRFSIVSNLPYDRCNTEMQPFSMCPKCSSEYQNPEDRRYYSQTNSCPDCGITVSLYDSKQNLLSEDSTDILHTISAEWKAGSIIAMKGIGGYLLTCDANNIHAINELRRRKHRPTKPLAVMYPNADSLSDFYRSKSTASALESEVSPIVLMELKDRRSLPKEIAPGLDHIGIMLPYTPFFNLALDIFKGPIVATSGNVSNGAIVYEDEKALTDLCEIGDFIITNNRNIVIPQDDSVFKFSKNFKQRIILRRSRGLAPTFTNFKQATSRKTILAMGADMKSTFSLLHKENLYISQYLGDLENYDVLKGYKSTVYHFLEMLNARPEVILSDLHSDFASRRLGAEVSQKYSVSVHTVQHHIAHFSAILGEHNLLKNSEPILGVIWDGSGLGTDGNIWGGEFIKYDSFNFTRCYHFDYFDHIVGDKMAKEPRISALSACWDVMGAEEHIRGKFSATEWQVYARLLENDSETKTSSTGRIFDAIASILGVMDKQSYEGEAAMHLEVLATRYFMENGFALKESYFLEGAHYYRIPTKSLMTNVLMDVKKGKSKGFIAAKFHYSLVQLIKIVANNVGTKQLAFSGGVFQNALLVDLIYEHLQNDFTLYFHKELSPNDENISFGQLMNYQIEQYKSTIKSNKVNDYVLSNSG